MAHQRQLIREYLRDILLGETDAEDRVTATRINPYRKGDLPAISVYTLEETVDQEQSNTAPREYTRNLKVEIAGWVTPGDGVDAAMDDLALQIETVIDGDRYLGDPTTGDDLAAETMLEGTTMSIKAEGDALTALVTLTYTVTYRNLAPVAPTELDDFLTADATYPLDGSTPDTTVLEDQITVRTP